MHAFKDKLGREWRIEATFGSYARVNASTGVKLHDIATESRESLTQLADPFTLGAVLWSMIEPQAQERGVSPEQFYDAIDGTVLVDAHVALVEEMIFFCHPRQRTFLQTAFRKILAAESKAHQQVVEMLPKFEAEIDQAINQWIHGDSDMSLRESSESTHEDGVSESLSKPQPEKDASSGITHAP